MMFNIAYIFPVSKGHKGLVSDFNVFHLIHPSGRFISGKLGAGGAKEQLGCGALLRCTSTPVGFDT